MIDRRIVAVHAESADTCVVELDCGHRRHVRDRPPFERYPWVRDATAHAQKIGATIECGRCDALERPSTAQRYREGTPWTSATLPAGLRKSHALKAGVWGELVVLAGTGRLRFDPPLARTLQLVAGNVIAIPPEATHELVLDDDAVVRIDFWR
ncbi:MAG TPA: DUF3565 domain-containing protein [Nannocystaceae bacterium]|nr:DUF3565 domain-containing protein [Nannocystaceae bacterium]